MLKIRQGKEIDKYGTERWYKDGKRHREDGPAVINTAGLERWYKDGKRHREDGPATIYSEGSQYWYLREYYLNGKQIKEEEYLKVLNCPIDELPLYINTELAPVVKRRLNHEKN